MLFVPHHKIDKEKWDDQISRSPHRTVYALSWYLDRVHPGWDALLLEDHSFVMPLTADKKFGIPRLIQPLFCQQLGIYGTESCPADISSLFLQEIAQRYRYICIHLHAGLSLSASVLAKQRRNYMLDLSQGYDSISTRYNQNTRRNIKKAQSNQLKITTKISPGELIAFKQKNAPNKLSRKHYQTLHAIVSEAVQKQKGAIWGAIDSTGRTHAVLFWLRSFNRMIYLTSATNTPGRTSRAMHLLVDETIRAHAGEALWLDFEGSEIPGVAQFFSGFGSNPEIYQQVEINRLIWPFKLFL